MRLVVFSGLCGSGKTTAAFKEFSGSVCAIVQYDWLRRMFPKKSAGEITKELVKTVAACLRSGNEIVIVDACNLHPHDKIRWETLAWAFDIELEWRFIDTPPLECMKRDAARQEPVGAACIFEQYRSYEGVDNQV